MRHSSPLEVTQRFIQSREQRRNQAEEDLRPAFENSILYKESRISSLRRRNIRTLSVFDDASDGTGSQIKQLSQMQKYEMSKIQGQSTFSHRRATTQHQKTRQKTVVGPGSQNSGWMTPQANCCQVQFSDGRTRNVSKQEIYETLKKKYLRPNREFDIKPKEKHINFIARNKKSCFSKSDAPSDLFRSDCYDKIQVGVTQIKEESRDSLFSADQPSSRGHKKLLNTVFLTSIGAQLQKTKNDEIQLKSENIQLKKQMTKKFRGMGSKKNEEKDQSERRMDDVPVHKMCSKPNFVPKNSNLKGNEYKFDKKEPQELKNKKTVQRQLNLGPIIENNPIIIGANPKILSLDGIPALEFIENETFGKDQFYRKKHGQFGIAEERMIKFKGVKFERELNQINLKLIGKYGPELIPKTTGSYNQTSFTIIKPENPGQNNLIAKLKKQYEVKEIKCDDFKKSYCNFDEEIKKTQTENFQNLISQDMEDYKRVNQMQEKSSELNESETFSDIDSHGQLPHGSIENESLSSNGSDDDIQMLTRTLRRQHQEIILRENRLKEYHHTKNRLEHDQNKLIKKIPSNVIGNIGSAQNKFWSSQSIGNDDAGTGAQSPPIDDKPKENHFRNRTPNRNKQRLSSPMSDKTETNYKPSSKGTGNASNAGYTSRSKKLRKIQEQFEKIETRYEDVLRDQIDLTQQYQTEKPKWFDDYKDSEHHQNFLANHLERKKKLEIQLLKDNKNIELVTKIIGLIEPGHTRNQNKNKFQKLKVLVKKRIYYDFVMKQQEKKIQENEEKSQNQVERQMTKKQIKQSTTKELQEYDIQFRVADQLRGKIQAFGKKKDGREQYKEMAQSFARTQQ